MKTKLIILASLIAIACNGQPDINCYSQQKWDSILSVNEVLQVQNNQHIIFENVLQSQITTLQQALDSQVNPTDTLIYNQDNISLKVDNDSLIANFDKIGAQVNYRISDGLNRITLWYNEGAWEVWFMDGAASWQHFNGVLR